MNGYVLVKSYYGWGGDLAILAEAITLSRRYDLEIIVDWRGSFSNRVETEDVFDHLLELKVRRAKLAEINEKMDVIPNYWRPFILKPSPYSKQHALTRCSRDDVDLILEGALKPYIVVVSRESSQFHKQQYQKEISESYKYIVPKKHVQVVIDETYASWQGRPMIGVHFRHGNGEATVVYPDIDWYFNKIDAFLERQPDAGVFVSTDCGAALDVFGLKYGGRMVSTPKSYPRSGSGGMHYFNSFEERIRSGEEAIADMWLLSKCKFFIGTKSFFSYAANFLAGVFGRENSAYYVHRIRSFKPDVDMVAIGDSHIKDVFLKSGIRLDGVFLKRHHEEFHVYLQDKLISTISGIPSCDEIADIEEKIKAIRLY